MFVEINAQVVSTVGVGRKGKAIPGVRFQHNATLEELHIAASAIELEALLIAG